MTTAAATILALAICAVSPALAQSVTPRPRAATPHCDAANFRVIVDVGHTPESPGAISARGIDEYTFNLALAKVIDGKLREAGFSRAHLLLANGDAIPSLVRRVAQANAMSADLLVSIHHDSVPEAFKSMWDFGGMQRPYSDRFRGHSIFVSADNADYQGSLNFAKMLGEQLKARGLHYTPHYKEAFMGARQRRLVDQDAGVYRYDQLLILRTARMPSVLLEAGSIVHRDEEEEMGTDARKAVIAQAVTEAVQRFCAVRPAKTQRASTQR
ncbi:MAG: N-acetylmuramoyl-L-alanine amidase family protein [Pseudorhodoplanes sp.]